MDEVSRFVSSTGNTVILRTDGTRWEVANISSDGKIIWIETSVDGNKPFSEDEAREEFERWRV